MVKAMDVPSAVITLFLIMDPLGNVPLFLSVLKNVRPERRRRVLLREIFFAYLVLLSFLFFGSLVLRALDLDQDTIRIAGGIVLFLIAIRMIFPSERFGESDELGGELNAATSRETTVVYARVPDSRLEVALEVMADMLYRPTFADVDSEREVVLEEIAMVEDTPHDLVHDLAGEAVFGGHPLGRPVIGRAEVISTVSRRALAHRRAGTK